jgi:hypothetical protein
MTTQIVKNSAQIKMEEGIAERNAFFFNLEPYLKLY